MPSYTRISCEDAHDLLQNASAAVAVIDVRDAESYAVSHVRGAQHVDNAGMAEFLETADADEPVIVYCYHGHMSQSVGAFLAERDFDQVYSLDGGFTAWAEKFPDRVATAGSGPGNQ